MNTEKAKQVVRAVKNRDISQLKTVMRWLLKHYDVADVLIWTLGVASAKLPEADIDWLFSQVENNTYLPTELKEKVDTASFKHLVSLGCEPGKDFVLTNEEFTISSKAEDIILSTIASP